MAGSMINRELISRPLTVLLRDEWNQGVTLYVTITLFPVLQRPECFLLFFFNDTATTEIYTLSLHDALPIYPGGRRRPAAAAARAPRRAAPVAGAAAPARRWRAPADRRAARQCARCARVQDAAPA